MGDMKYKVGDKVLIKSLDWYNEHTLIDTSGVFRTSIESLCLNKKRFMGKELTICSVLSNGHYLMEETGVLRWTDEMIEGLVEEDKPKFKVGDKITNGKENLTILHIKSDKYIVEDNLGEYDTLYFDTQNDWGLLREKVIATNEPFEKETEWNLPDGYQFKDENGNVINTKKIVLEKKEKRYPKTYEECCEITNLSKTSDIYGYKNGLLFEFQKLLIARDAYWKIAGEEMGLGKPWEPDWRNSEERRYSIVNIEGDINLPETILTKWILKVTNKILVFPIEEMRDAFYENFKELIEICKELL